MVKPFDRLVTETKSLANHCKNYPIFKLQGLINNLHCVKYSLDQYSKVKVNK